MPKLSIANKAEFSTIKINGETVGKRIAIYRKKRGLTQKELAARIGIDRTIIANYERDRARIYDEILARISVALNVSADILLGTKEFINNKDNISLRVMKRIKKIETLPPAKQKIILRNIDLNLAGLEK